MELSASVLEKVDWVKIGAFIVAKSVEEINQMR
jgi:hypothetical protein